MSAEFTLTPMDVALPRGAFQGGGRDILRHGDRPLCAFTRGTLRPCLHPVWTPAGHVVTAEQPADHPHHRGIWVASDHVGLMMQGPDGVERYDYCFYVDEVFQGRAPGRIVQTALRLVAHTEDSATVEQRLDWIGPQEWGADPSRMVLRERRTTGVQVTDNALILDITSEVTPAGDVPVTLGPTRHAWFNARLTESIALAPDSAPVDDLGRLGGAEIGAHDTAWVDYSGPVGGGRTAGITVLPFDGEKPAWFVADWGVITTGAIRDKARALSSGQTARFACRFVAHDGPAPQVDRWKDIPFAAPDAWDTTDAGGSE